MRLKAYLQGLSVIDILETSEYEGGAIMDIYRADRLPFDCREELGIIFADGFTQWLGFFSRIRI